MLNSLATNSSKSNASDFADPGQLKRLLLTLRYDGTNYCGWQVQKNGITIQQVLQDAIERVTGVRSGVIGCSRTDSGVHAKMFCCTFDTLSNIAQDNMIRALNASLPEDIVVFDCAIVDKGFHPRYDAVWKRYSYNIYNSRVRDPFNYKYHYQVISKLSVDKMRQAAKLFVGTHDFSAFCSAGSSVATKERTIFLSEVNSLSNEGQIAYTVQADGFLYNMVRIIVGTLIEVGLSKIDVCDVADIIKSKDRTDAGATAPPTGLFLEEVKYK